MRAKHSVRPFRHESRGFTLIELMVVVVVLGIIAAIAYPAYTKQINRTRRSDAVAALGILQQAQERYRANSQVYADTLELLKMDSHSPKKYYVIAIQQAGPTGYTITATAASGGLQANDAECTGFTLTMNGANITTSATGSNPANCWPK
ncbi:MAG TPA: type IV pilin protein [Burkholderiaceae bacterium]